MQLLLDIYSLNVLQSFTYGNFSRKIPVIALLNVLEVFWKYLVIIKTQTKICVLKITPCKVFSVLI